MTKDEFESLRIGERLKDKRGQKYMLIAIRRKNNVRVLIVLGTKGIPETRNIRPGSLMVDQYQRECSAD